MADFAGLDNVPNRASNQTGTLQFMAIDHESFSTSFYRCAFVMVTMGDRANQQGDKDMGKWIAAMRQSALWERVIGKCTGWGLASKTVYSKGLRKAVLCNEAIESNEHASYCIIQ